MPKVKKYKTYPFLYDLSRSLFAHPYEKSERPFPTMEVNSKKDKKTPLNSLKVQLLVAALYWECLEVTLVEENGNPLVHQVRSELAEKCSLSPVSKVARSVCSALS